MIKELTANLMVENVNSTVDFYKNRLGFELVTTVPELGMLNWAAMKSRNVKIMFPSASSLGNDLPEMKDMKAGGTFLM